MTEIVQRTPAQELAAQIRGDEFRDQLKLALPENVTVDRFARATITALLQNPDLINADRESLFQSVLKSAQDGLVPDGRQAALVIMGGKVAYLPMIAGVRKIAAEFGWTIRTHAVYANDRFEVIEGTDQRVDHRPTPPGSDRGDIVAAYAVAHHRDGRTSIVEVMHKVDIDKARAVAKTKNVWNQWPAQMSEKTVGHRIAKKLPLDPQDRARLDRVIDAAALEPGQAATLLYGPAADKPASEEPGHAAPSTDTEAGGPQAGDAHEPAEAASPAPGPEDKNDFGGAEGTVATDEAADMEAAQEAAGHVVSVPKKENWVNGLTLAQINARDEDGVLFFRWALGRTNESAELKAAATAYAKVQLPFVYAELVEAGA